VSKTLGDSFAVGFVGHLLRGHVEVVLVVGVLDVRQEVSTAAHQMETPAQEIPGCAHLRGVDVGLGQIPTSQQMGDLEGVEPVVLGLGPMDGLHVQRVAEHEGDSLARTQVGEPVPGEDALDPDHEVFAVRGHRLQEGLGAAAQVLVQEHLAFAVEEAEVHGLGVQIDSAVVRVAGRVESHGSLLKRLGWLVQPAYVEWRRHRRGPG
jgi:hypothetical protein